MGNYGVCLPDSEENINYSRIQRQSQGARHFQDTVQFGTIYTNPTLRSSSLLLSNIALCNLTFLSTAFDFRRRSYPTYILQSDTRGNLHIV